MTRFNTRPLRVGAGVLALAVVGLGAYLARQTELLEHLRVSRRAERVVVLASGDEPRTLLRYNHTRAPQPFMSVSQRGLSRVMGVVQQAESYLPPLSVQWTEPRMQVYFGSSRIAWRIGAGTTTIDDEKVDAKTREQIGGLLAKVVGSELVVWTSPSGWVHVQTPPATSPDAQRLLDELAALLEASLAVPLPAVPVGKGAKWTASISGPEMLAAKVTHAFEYTLSDTEGDALEIEVKLSYSADAQPANAPGAPSKERFVIDNVTGEGIGRTVLMLGEATPVRSDFASQIEMSMTREEEDKAAPTTEKKLPGHFLALKRRAFLQATRLGPIEWSETR